METQDQLAFLQAMNCDEYQGFLSSRAVDPKEFGLLLQRLPQIQPILVLA